MSSTSPMSTMTHVTLQHTEEDPEKKLEWSYIEWAENEGPGVCQAQTQTEGGAQTEGGGPEQSERGTQTDGGTQTERGTQTSSPLIMHIDLSRTHSRLRHSSLVDSEGLPAPFFHFDRQAPGRISTSPTLRRMRSTRRPQSEYQETAMSPTQREYRDAAMSPTQEEPSPTAPLSPLPPQSPLSPVPRIISPLALSGNMCQVQQHISSSGRQRTKSHRSKTFDNGITFPRPERHSLHLSLSTDFVFPDRSESKEKELSHSRLQERRRSSVVVSLPGLDVSPGDLFVSNGAAHLLNGSTLSDSKKSKWPFSRRSTTKGKPQLGSASDVEKHLSSVQIQDWRNVDLQKYKEYCVAEFLMEQLQEGPASDPQIYKRQESVWELFTSECVYFLDQLMVLKEVFLSTLSSLQTHNCLSDVDVWRLFANLHELCLVSFGFLNKLLTVVTDTQSTGGPALLQLLSKVFKESVCHSLQKYCLNYSTALQYLDVLKSRDDFGSYVKWCERNDQCRRLQLRDLLVAPLQRLTRYPLLLRNICKRLETEEETRTLHSVAEQVDTAICDLEGKVKWLDNYQKVKQLRDALVWLPVWERDKRAFVPENLKHLLKAVTLENLITHRSLLHDGKLLLTENTKLLDVYLFLFDEFLLITKIKRNKKRSAGPDQNPLRLPQNQELEQLLKENCSFTVVDQPLSLDRVQVKNIHQLNTTSGLPQSFIIMHQNRYQQCIGAFILQAPSETAKRVWMSKVEDAVSSLLKQDSQQLRLKSASLWLESSQI